MKQNKENLLMKLRIEYDNKSNDMKNVYKSKMKNLRLLKKQEKDYIIKQIELRKQKHINKLLKIHHNKFDNIKEYYRDITRANLERIKSLKEIIGEMKKKNVNYIKKVKIN